MSKNFDSTFFVTKEGTEYKRTINEGKTFWYVCHGNDAWHAISGCPSVVLFEKE